MRNNKTFFIKKFLRCVCLLLLIFIVANASVFIMLVVKNNSYVKKTGPNVIVLELWNIDSFDGGNYSKSVFLERVANRFYMKNKNVCVVIKNLTKESFESLKGAGVCPDIISCAPDVFENVKNNFCLSELNDVNGVKACVVDGDCVVGVPWCVGAYFMFSTNERLYGLKCDKKDMLKNCLNLGFEKKMKNRVKIIKSLTYGGVYEQPEKALKCYGFDVVSFDKTAYDAYVEFLNGDATILVGTQRDYCRLMSRVNFQGGVICEILSRFNNLFQYISIVSTDSEKVSVCQKFIQELMSVNVQKNMRDFGMFSAVVNVDYEDEVWNNYQNLVLSCL